LSAPTQLVRDSVDAKKELGVAASNADWGLAYMDGFWERVALGHLSFWGPTQV